MTQPSTDDPLNTLVLRTEGAPTTELGPERNQSFPKGHFWACITLFAAAFFWRTLVHLNHDATWLLTAAQRILEGLELYREIVEVNPPWPIWVMLPIAASANAVGLSPVYVFTGALFACIAASIALTDAILRLTSLPRGDLIVATTVSLLFVSGGDFGQREHLLITLALPWLVLRGVTNGTRRIPDQLSLMVGVLAAVGFWMKPHSFLIVIAVEASVVLRTRQARYLLAPECVVIWIASAVYIACIWHITPGFLAVMDLGIRAYIPYYRTDGVGIAVHVILALAVSALLIFATRHTANTTACVGRTLAAGLIGAGAAYGLQAGFRYQFLPATTIICVGIVAIAPLLRDRALRFVPLATVATYALLGVIGSASYAGRPFEAAIATHRTDARAFFVASTNVSHAFPLAMERRLNWTSRFPTQWLAPYVAEHGPETPIAKFALRATVDDLIAGKPDIVFVDNRPSQSYFRGLPLDFIEFWMLDPRFRDFWNGYAAVGEHEGFGVFVRGRGYD